MRHHTHVCALGLLIAVAGCSPKPDFDGIYQVSSYTLNETSCDAPGPEIEREFPRFRVEARDWFGVRIYPVYPCDESGACAENNDATWSLVTLEEDVGQVSATTAWSDGDACVLGSVDLVIDGVDGNLVLEQRSYELVIAPYDAATCTTGRAEAARDEMDCVQLRQLVGAPDEPDRM